MAVGELLICDYKHQCVFVLDSEWTKLIELTLGTTGNGQLTHPAVDEDGTIAESDYRFHQVKRFCSLMENIFVLLVHLALRMATLTIPVDLLLAVMDSSMSWTGVTQGFKFSTNRMNLPLSLAHKDWAHQSLTIPLVLQWTAQTMCISLTTTPVLLEYLQILYIYNINCHQQTICCCCDINWLHLADDHDKSQWNPKHQLIGQFGKEVDR